MSNIVKYSVETFDSIRHINEDGQEFWYARELQSVLEYAKWENFANVIDKAKEACKNSANIVEDHFPDVRKMVIAGVATKEIDDMMLSRYACALSIS